MTRHMSINRFTGVNPSVPARQLPDGVLADALNMYFENDAVITRFGYAKVGRTLNGKIMGGAKYQKLLIDENHTVVCTPSDIYRWSGTDWGFITPVHIQGTVEVNGTAVTGTDTGWLPAWETITRPYQIRFGTNDANAAVSESVTGWFDISAIASATALTLAADAGVIAAGTQYCIRRTLQGGVDNYYDFAQPVDDDDAERVLVVVNGVDRPVLFDGVDSVFVDTAPRCRYLAVLFNFTLAGDLDDGGQQWPDSIWNSEIGSPRDWTIGDNGTAYGRRLTDTSDRVTALKVLGEMLVAYKERSASILALSGGDGVSEDPFDMRQNVINAGTFSGRTVQIVQGDRHMFMGGDDIMVFTGAQIVPIGGAFKTSIYKGLNLARLNRCHSVIVADLDAYLLFTPSLSSEECDLAWLYNYTRNTWSAWRFAHAITAAFTAPIDVAASTRWQDVPDGVTWSMMTELAGSRNTASVDVPIFGDENGNVYRFSGEYDSDAGVDIPCSIVTAQYLSAITPMVSLLGVDIITGAAAPGSRIRVYVSVNGEVWLSPFVLDVGSADDYLHSLMAWTASGRCVQIMVENYEGSAFVFKSLDIEFTGAGRIVVSDDV